MRLSELSNFGCLPSRAGGSPFLFRKRVKGDESETAFSYMMMQPETKPRYKTVIETRTVEYGPYIPTLVKLLESGEFS